MERILLSFLAFTIVSGALVPLTTYAQAHLTDGTEGLGNIYRDQDETISFLCETDTCTVASAATPAAGDHTVLASETTTIETLEKVSSTSTLNSFFFGSSRLPFDLLKSEMKSVGDWFRDFF